MHASSRNLVELPCWYSDRCAIYYSPCGRPTRQGGFLRLRSLGRSLQTCASSSPSKKDFRRCIGGRGCRRGCRRGGNWRPQEHRQPLRWARDHAVGGGEEWEARRSSQSMSRVERRNARDRVRTTQRNRQMLQPKRWYAGLSCCCIVAFVGETKK